MPVRAQTAPLSYRPQLDALRTAAVMSVLYTHFWSGDGPGHQGVRLFFVISGFLITGILLKQREQEQTVWQKLGTFYARRTIRIWPTYYLTLFVAALINADNIRSSLPWHLAYLSNVYYIKTARWVPGVAAHLWSLSVEEQFYLLWPLTILFVPRRLLVWVIVSAIAVAVAYRAVISLTSMSFPDIATPAAFDALGLGSALALANHMGIPAKPLGRWLAVAAAVALLAYLAVAGSGYVRLDFALSDFFLAMVFTSIVAAADRGIEGPLLYVLEWPPVLYLGRISYGIYLYHLFVEWKVTQAAWDHGIDVPPPGPLHFVIMGGLTILTASISWFAVERPLASLKRRLSYTSPSGPRRTAEIAR